MSTQYERGAEFERRVAKRLTVDGYACFRSAGSHGKADIVAIKPGQILLIQCKRDGEISRAEWNGLLELAHLIQPSLSNGLGRRVVWPLLAFMPGRQGISYRMLLRPAEPHQRRSFSVWAPDGVQQ